MFSLRPARSLAVVCALALTACTLVTAGLDLDSSFGARGVDPDGGLVAKEAGGANDAGVLCQPDAHALCDDFDTSPLGAPEIWSRLRTEPKAELTLSPDIHVSAPYALSATLEAETLSPATVMARLERDLAGELFEIDCTFQLRIERSSITGLVVPISIFFEANADAGSKRTEVSFFISRRESGIMLVEFADDAKTNFPATEPLDEQKRWRSVRLRVQRRSDGLANATLSVDDGEVAGASLNIPSGTQQMVRFGLARAEQGSSVWHVLLDDLVCDTK
jgi:hypothetical protein